jgi:hypothetical protein
MTLFLEQLAEYSAHNADLRPFLSRVLTLEFARLQQKMAHEQARRDRAEIIREQAQRRKATQR